MSKRVLIVGGVAAGASAATRLRRLDEGAEIVLFDRGPYVSFANCGLPYYVGNVIPEEKDLLVASPELFHERFNIDVRAEHEVQAIDRAARTIRVMDRRSGAIASERYDVLVLAPGAAPIRLDAVGVDLPGVFVVRDIPDSRRIRAWMDSNPRAEAVVVGGGFIGLEMAENLQNRGLAVSVLEKVPQVMPPLDPEMAVFVARHLREKGVRVHLGEGLARIEQEESRLAVRTDRGAVLATDMVILALGVRPETTLAREAGLRLGARGGIVVDEQMRTSDASIYAVGDAIEVHDVVVGQETILPLAGPANRQGRVAGEAIAGRNTRFRGVQGTRGTVYDLAEAELCYAPQYGSAKDPINVAGMMAVNALRGDMPLADWTRLREGDPLILDVRERSELDSGAIEGAVNLPMSSLRHNLEALPRDREIWLFCAAGQRAYFAQRLLLQNGYRAHNLSVGYQTYAAMREAGLAA